MQQTLNYEFPNAIAEAVGTGAFVSLCSIQQRSNTVDSLGQVDLADWVNVPGLQNLPCILGVYKPAAPDKAAEMHFAASIDTSNYRHVLLNGSYPAIVQQYRALVDGVAYDIIATENDSQATMTRLAVRIYSQ